MELMNKIYDGRRKIVIFCEERVDCENITTQLKIIGAKANSIHIDKSTAVINFKRSSS